MDTIDQQIEILNIIKQGKTIQYKRQGIGTQVWTDCVTAWHAGVKAGSMPLHLDMYTYRAKPEPRIVYVNEYTDNNGYSWYTVPAKTKEEALLKKKDSKNVVVTRKFIEVSEEDSK